MGDVSKSKLKYERQVFSSTHSGDFKVVEYVNAHKVVVEFLFTGEKVIAQMRDILEGRVKDRMYPSVYGVGITGEKIPVAEGKRCKQRELWVRMLDRCYSEKYRLKSPSYVGCTVSDSFKYFPHFKDWCSNQIGFDVKGFALDKDILVKGNKLYSEETCCFVPQELNNLLTYKKATNNGLPISVSEKKSGKFGVSFRKNSVTQNLGVFDTVEEAFYTYKQAKEDYIKVVANRWRDQIDPRVYDALMSYTVEITE